MRRSNVFRAVQPKKLAHLVSDAGLDSWAKRHGVAVPGRLRGKARLAARVLYGEIAPGLESMKLEKSFTDTRRHRPTTGLRTEYATRGTDSQADSCRLKVRHGGVS
jgi:hypothetical protein